LRLIRYTEEEEEEEEERRKERKKKEKFLKQLEDFFSYFFYFDLQENDRFVFSESLLSNTNTVLLNWKIHIHQCRYASLNDGVTFYFVVVRTCTYTYII